MRFDLGTLDSGERSLPFGLLVSFIFLLYIVMMRSMIVTLQMPLEDFAVDFTEPAPSDTTKCQILLMTK